MLPRQIPVLARHREGAFLTGSLTTLAPLRMLDGAPCLAPGGVFDMLASSYRAFAGLSD